MAKVNIIQPYSLFGGTGKSVFYHKGTVEVIIPVDALESILVLKPTAVMNQMLQEPSLNGSEVTIRNESTHAITVKVPTGTTLDELTSNEFSLTGNGRVTFVYEKGSKTWILKAWDNSQIAP